MLFSLIIRCQQGSWWVMALASVGYRRLLQI